MIRAPEGLIFLLDGESRTIALRNEGPGTLEIVAAHLEGEHAPDFSIIHENFANVALYPGSGCSLGVRFKTRAGDHRRAALRIVCKGADDDYIIPLAGFGPALELVQEGCDRTLRAKLGLALPVGFTAHAECGEPVIECGRQQLVAHGCDMLLAQEFRIAIPVRVRAVATCDGDQLPEERCDFTICQTVRVELPVSTEVALGECEEDGGLVRIGNSVCDFTAVQVIDLGLPISFDAELACAERIHC